MNYTHEKFQDLWLLNHFFDAEGNEIWICPQCNKPDNGSPMIGCDAGCKDYNNHSRVRNQSWGSHCQVYYIENIFKFRYPLHRQNA